MRVAEFDFALPPDRIAAHPAKPRDAARLLVVGPGGYVDRHVRDLPGELAAGDLLVVNDTRVIPAALSGRRGAAAVALTLLRRLGGGEWEALARPAKRLRAGDQIDFADGTTAKVAVKGEGGAVHLRFDLAAPEFARFLARVGVTPLPPYIRRSLGPTAADRRDYQTVYAAHDGAVAAPTAGLHLTPRLFSTLAAAGVGLVAVTLHVGAGTFLPVKTERTEDHVMHAESATVSADAAARINATRRAGGRIVAVGTTSLRALESAAKTGEVSAFAGDTALFITPGYRFRVVDRLLTNFHLPRSTLFMLVAAFAGLPRMQGAYAHAVAAGYRFYSYGDACLLHREGRA